ncbi:hypothetical protein ACROYT_G036034 [Oculina patagonica]
MRIFSCLVSFLLLVCKISFTLGYDVCDPESSKLAYRCGSTTGGTLSPLKLPEKYPYLPDAEELDLSRNKLSLSDGCFTPFKNLQTFDLSNNDIKEFSPDVFDDLVNLIEVRLQNNPLDCDCEKGLMTLLTRRNINLGPVPATCHEPFRFRQLNVPINQHCDVNECLEENDCDDMATCTDMPYTYDCRCNSKGFKGTGKECTDIDECAGKNRCSKVGGLCINTHGSYKCSCKKGFTGDGKRCEDIDECNSHECREGECTNTIGSFSCDCHEGYAVNKKQVCVDIDECKSKNNTCAAIEHSYCVNVEKFLPSDDGYHCLCETGYRQVGRSCVAEGNMKGLIKILAMIIGGFFGILFIIIIVAVIVRKWRNRTPKPEKKEETPVVMAPVVGLDPLVDFAYLGMPQAEQEGQEEAEEEWGELYEDEEED